MKMFFAFLVFSLFFSITQADVQIDKNEKINQILKDKWIEIEWPAINFNGTAIPINYLCTDGAVFKTQNPYPVCVQTAVVSRTACRIIDNESCTVVDARYKPREHEVIREVTECVKYVKKPLEISRSHHTLRCNGTMVYPMGEKTELPYCKGSWVPSYVLIATEMQVTLTSVAAKHSEQGYRIIGFENYSIPTCAP